jgi:hypothetical protein
VSVPEPEPIWISFEGTEPPSRRSLDAAIFARFPAVLRAVARFALGLPRRSKLRQALLRRAVLQSMGAWMRADFELALARYHHEASLTTTASDRLRLDIDTSYRGRDGIRAAVETYQEVFSGLSYEPEWLIDLGDNRFAMLLHHDVRGRASGIEVEQLSAHRLEMRNGLVVREEITTAPVHNLEGVARAVGVDPAELASRRATEREG